MTITVLLKITKKENLTLNNQPTNGGYLFVFFTGTEDSPDAEQLYFALSKDGLHWTDINHNQPVLTSTIGEKGVRDPFIIRKHNGTGFTIMATDLSIYHRGGWPNAKATSTGSQDLIFWDSDDLLDWSDPRAVTMVDQHTGCVWAPEAVYDPDTEKYFVFWSSPNTETHEMEIWSAYTEDFIHFEDTKTYAKYPGHELIDMTMVHDGDQFVRASRDGTIPIEKSASLAGPWEKVTTLQDLGLGIHGDTVEGPEIVWLADAHKWCVYVDQFDNGRGYLPILTGDLTSANPDDWEVAPDYDFGTLKKRHGSIMALTPAEYAALQARY